MTGKYCVCVCVWSSLLHDSQEMKASLALHATAITLKV